MRFPTFRGRAFRLRRGAAAATKTAALSHDRGTVKTADRSLKGLGAGGATARATPVLARPGLAEDSQ